METIIPDEIKRTLAFPIEKIGKCSIEKSGSNKYWIWIDNAKMPALSSIMMELLIDGKPSNENSETSAEFLSWINEIITQNF